MSDARLREQIDYYAARAGEYDDWWYRRGRYDRGPEANARWLADIAEVEQALAALGPLGDVVELAAGTGLWTRWLSPLASSVTAVDANAEVLARNATRVANDKVRYEQADLFAWRPPRRFDTVFFGFWLSHIPPPRLASFWTLVADLLEDGGRFFFVDSRDAATSGAVDRLPPSDGEATRRVADGREYRIVKVFHEPDDLRGQLEASGWRCTVDQTAEYFIYGSGQKA